MEPNLSDSLKAILVKIALELKKKKWVSDPETNELDIAQNHLSLSKTYSFNNGVDVGVHIEMTLAPGEGGHYVIFKEEYLIDCGHIEDKFGNSDASPVFTQKDSSNTEKIQLAASEIEKRIQSKSLDYAENCNT
jgi:hypothetical protein